MTEIPASAVDWLCYEYLTHKFDTFSKQKEFEVYSPTVHHHLISIVAGGISGILGGIASNPIDRSTILLQGTITILAQMAFVLTVQPKSMRQMAHASL